MRRRSIIAATAAAVALTGCTSRAPTATTSPSASETQISSNPSASPSGYGSIDPANFVSAIDNPYYPLPPGMTLVYMGVRDEQVQRDVVHVTDQTKSILGVKCVVVMDTATHKGSLIEKTEDWFAQDKEGNVWYFGEDTAEYEDGKVVSREGSWQAGVDGAQPGIIMPARPEVPASYRQEYLKDHAEDMAWIVSTDEKIEVPAGSFQSVLLTIEWTRLEPKVLDKKFYAPGIGIVKEISASGPKETAELVSFTKP